MLSKNWLVGEPRKAITFSTEVLMAGLKLKLKLIQQLYIFYWLKSNIMKIWQKMM